MKTGLSFEQSQLLQKRAEYQEAVNTHSEILKEIHVLNEPLHDLQRQASTAMAAGNKASYLRVAGEIGKRKRSIEGKVLRQKCQESQKKLAELKSEIRKLSQEFQEFNLLNPDEAAAILVLRSMTAFVKKAACEGRLQLSSTERKLMDEAQVVLGTLPFDSLDKIPLRHIEPQYRDAVNYFSKKTDAA